MTMHAFNSLSPGAPQLTGAPGSLISVLNYCLVTGMGWSVAYTATNQAAYQQPAGSNGFFLNVNDSTGQNAQLCGFETMSAIGVGVNQSPPVADVGTGGGYLYKSGTQDTTARPWVMYSNGKLFYLCYYGYGTVGSSMTMGSWHNMFVFGDFPSFKAGDAFNTIILSESAPSQNSSSSPVNSNYSSFFYQPAGVGTSVMRAATQIGTAFAPSRWSDWGGGANMSSFGTGTIPYPSSIDGGINIAKVYVGESAGRRGVLPGLWWWCHSTFLNPFDTFNGAGALAGRSFVCLPAVQGMYVIETSDTWSI